MLQTAGLEEEHTRHDVGFVNRAMRRARESSFVEAAEGLLFVLSLILMIEASDGYIG
jgi:hypothetical protein